LFAVEGIASIRYDKRSFVYDLAKDEQSLDNVVVADAAAAATRLGEEERVSDVVVFGHGLGGVATPRIARDADVTGMVLAATPTRPLAEVFLDIERRKATADGTVTHAERQRLDLFRENLARTSDLGPDDDYYIFGRATTFWRDLHALDVVRAVGGRPEPTLVLHPERSFVTTDADRAVWADLLGHAGVRVYPDLDHLFMRVFGESLPEAYFFPDTVVAAVAADVAAWVRDVVVP
jgi:alpha-beta hydrolase superfamily lysophospholipase